MDARDLLNYLNGAGFTFFTGVPCSYLTPVINVAMADPRTTYVGATNEGEAIAIAAGAWLAGRETVVMMQNSGLGNAINPLTSMNFPFRIPGLLIVTWRGRPGTADEPQHELMGEITHKLLSACRVDWCQLPRTARELELALRLARTRDLPFALIAPGGLIEGDASAAIEPLTRDAGQMEDRCCGGRRPARFEVLERFLESVRDDAAVIATTGKCGRELFTLADRDQHLYQVGSMGCASAMGLGLSMNVQRPVVVLDGDGAALMKLGNLATIGRYAPKNLVHVIFNNEAYDSTGGQQTAASNVDFCAIAVATGYRYAVVCDGVGEFDTVIRNSFMRDGPQLIEVKIAIGSIKALGRPTIRPADVASRFKSFLKAGEINCDPARRETV